MTVERDETRAGKAANGDTRDRWTTDGGMGSAGMKWLGLVLAGPMIWAIGFSVVYGLHGAGCARGWTEVSVAGGITLFDAALWAGWLATLAANTLLLLALSPARVDSLAPARDTTGRMPRTGAWIGLGASFFSLLPVAVASSCYISG